MEPKIQNKTAHVLLFLGLFMYSLFCLKEIGNFYQTGHAGFINAEVGLSHMNTINNGFLKTKLGATNYEVIIDRSPAKEEYYVRYPYLHNFVVSILWKITGPSEIAARLLMIIMVLTSIGVFYLIARELQYSRLVSALVFFTLCSFPVFFHYASLSNGEISLLLPLALAYFFYIKYIKQGQKKIRLYFLLSLSVACQLFWYGYLAALLFFFDSLREFFFRRDKKDLILAGNLVLTVLLNFSFYIIHTLWLIGSLKEIFTAFLWRANIDVPTTQIFSWKEFFTKNFNRWWLFNPIVIVLALINIVSLFKSKDEDRRLKQRILILLLLTPLLFSLFLSHLVQYHDFLLIYFSFFLALAAVDLLALLLKKTMSHRKLPLISAYAVVLLFFAVLGLFRQPEEKMIDKETKNYDLYYALKVVRHTTTPQDNFILSLQRAQEPQVRFYLRRKAFFLRVIPWAEGYVSSGKFTHFLVEDRARFKPIITYLLHNYRGHKYNRYFLFNLNRPGKGLRIFRRNLEKTSLLYKYFVSPYHQPGKFQEIHSQTTIQRIFERFPVEESQNYP